jgi:hypothetical protein
MPSQPLLYTSPLRPPRDMARGCEIVVIWLLTLFASVAVVGATQLEVDVEQRSISLRLPGSRNRYRGVTESSDGMGITYLIP